MQASNRVPQLDGIRGIAILLVILWHYGVEPIKAEPATVLAYLQKSLWLSWSGVDLFFVLSGYLIGGILLENRESSNYFRVFYFRRTARIFPLYYGWLIVFWVLASIGALTFPKLLRDPLPWWSYAFYIQNIVGSLYGSWGPQWFGMTWSLAVEEQFYLVVPLIVWLIPVRRLAHALIVFIAITPLLRSSLYLYLANDNDRAFQATYTLLPCRMDALLIGVLCAWTVRHRPELIKPKWLYAALLVSVPVIADLINNLNNFKLATYGYTVIAIFFACFLLLAVRVNGPISRFTSQALLQKTGVLAYGLYMFHTGVNGLLHGLVLKQDPKLSTFADLGVTAFSLIITFVLAHASWRFFEAPILTWGHKWKYKAALASEANASSPYLRESQSEMEHRA